MASKTILTKDRTVISYSLMPGPWDTCSDPGQQRDVTMFRESADGDMLAATGRTTYEDITLTRFWVEARDMAIVAQFKANADAYNDGTLTLINRGADGVVGAPDSYVGTVKSVKRSGGDANSADQQKLEVVLAISRGA